MIPYKQLSVADIFKDCQDKFENDKPDFLSLLEQHIDMDEIIPLSFRNHFYASTGRTRKYPLQAFLWALIIQRIFSIPTDKLLLVFLNYSKPLREFCGFSKVPDASKITRFKQDFLEDLQVVFDNKQIIIDVYLDNGIERVLNTHDITLKVIYGDGFSLRIHNPIFTHAIILVVVELANIIV